jgi:hypothetical protein
MTTTSEAVWTTEDVKLSGATVRLRKGGTGAPLLLLHHDVGSLDRLPFYDALTKRFTDFSHFFLGLALADPMSRYPSPTLSPFLWFADATSVK